MTTTAVRRPTRPDALVQGTQVLLALFGTVKLAGTAYFLFVADAEQGGDPEGFVDWSVGVWSTVLALAFLDGAARLAADTRRTVRALTVVVVVDVVFSFVKFFGYDEPEAVGFVAVSLVILSLLALVSRRSR